MGLFGALTTAVSGLRGQSYAMQNISGNIANSQTPGFKRVDTSFVDMIPELPFGREVAGSVNAFSRLTNTLKGDPLETGRGTNVMINGEGFFIVQERVGYANSRPVFGGQDRYTRRGDFQLDKDGYLVNGAGYYLRGLSINPATGDPVGNGILQISNSAVPARRTSEVIYTASLPKTPATTGESKLFGPTGVAGYEPRTNPSGTPAVTMDAVGGVRKSDTSRFISESIDGGSVTIYDAVGLPITMQIRWAKIDDGGAAEDATWNMFYLENENPPGVNDTTWKNMGAAIRFDANGQMTAPVPANITIAAPGPSVNGATLGGPLNFAFGSGGLKQYHTNDGLMRGETLTQDGYASGVIDGVSVDADGRVMGSYTNGRVLPVAQNQIAQFNADDALRRLDGGVYEQTLESGIPILGLNGSSLIGGHIEASNTDIAEEFSKMIVTQQAYSANTRVVSTAQTMMSEIVNMVR